MMHKVYLPFTEYQLLTHFADVKQNGECSKNKKHLRYYKKSIDKYVRYLANSHSRLGRSLNDMRSPCQIEKDERFWIAACMMTVFHSPNRLPELVSLFKDAYGTKPPIPINSWEECFEGELHLFFEAKLPSPQSYRKWLLENLAKRHFIPYVIGSAHGKRNLEGPTNVDAIFLNSSNGFAVIVEAKVLSDMSYDVNYDCVRNQIARNIDVMLEKNSTLCDPLSERVPERTLFLLITPRFFRRIPSSRLYGYKFNEYKNKPLSLAQDLPHRRNCDWENIAERLGWLTWEDFKDVNNNCCPWLS